MFAKIASFAAAALVIASIAPPAHAGVKANGLALNGLALNGLSINGLARNGLARNGLARNGLARNGLSRNGAAPATVNFTIDGIELPTVSQ